MPDMQVGSLPAVTAGAGFGQRAAFFVATGMLRAVVSGAGLAGRG
jgi:hypothetical protein